MILICAVFTAISRVMDHKHHASDVIAGSIIGIFAQIFNVFCVMENFEKTGDISNVDVIDEKSNYPMHTGPE